MLGLSVTHAGVFALGVTTPVGITAAGILQVNNTTDATSITNGSLQTDGGLSVAKRGFFGGSIAFGNAASTAGTGFISSKNTGAIAASGTYEIVGVASGLIVVHDNSVGNYFGVFCISASNTIVEIADPSNAYTVTKNTAGFNLYWETSKLYIQNYVATSGTFTITEISANASSVLA